eukprot:m.665600 g.665600  ORF g.665600 m.665600 type:complete len:527 (-) comp58493_c0_seq3:92-1672(-)
MDEADEEAMIAELAARQRANKVVRTRDTAAAQSFQQGERKVEMRIHFYEESPEEEITLSQFEELALARLKLLREIERVQLVEEDKLDSSDRTAHVHIAVRKTQYKVEAFGAEDRQAHFILRLAFCSTEDKRRWFMQQETDLFRYRLQIGAYDEYSVINRAKIHCEKVDHADCPPVVRNSLPNKQIYKVPFEQVLSLVQNRQVALVNGEAYLLQSQLEEIIVSAFRARLSAALTKTFLKYGDAEEDDRLTPILKALTSFSEAYVSKAKVGTVTAAEVPGLSKELFPLCMRNIQETLQEVHHVHHGARLQYMLFLKGIGLALQESIIFWRGELIQSRGADKFEKEYAYNVRHAYGQEGSRKNYRPQSCVQIIQGNVGPQDEHGCPFKHCTEKSKLKLMLSKAGVSVADIGEIMPLVESQQYGLACGTFFAVTRKLDKMAVGYIESPNQYFDMGRIYKDTGVEPSQQAQFHPGHFEASTSLMTMTPIKLEFSDSQMNTPVSSTTAVKKEEGDGFGDADDDLALASMEDF